VQHYFAVRAAAAALVATVALPLVARAEGPACSVQDQVRFADPLARVGKKLSAGMPVTVVAIGSSSTAGAGASSPASSYPSRLQVELRERFKRDTITVVNRGVNGEEVLDMLKRFDQAVVAAKPDLVIWQLGTNSVIRDHKFTDNGAAIHTGIAKIRATGADVILIDPQYAPKVIAKPDANRMVELIALIAKQDNVDLYPRFQVMRRWHDIESMDFMSFVSPDGLHMNDWSYGCLAKSLGLAIAEAAQRPVLSASGHAFAD
jgi:lysophospholipase L1-like esterase